MIRRIALLSVLACTKRELTTIDLSDREDVVAFAVVLDERGHPVRVTHPFGVIAGALTFGDRAEIELVSGEAEAMLVEIDQTELSLLRPDYVRARAAEIRVEVQTPPEPPVLDDHDPSSPFEMGALPAVAEIRTAMDAAPPNVDASVRANVTLTLPVDPEYCRPTSKRFEAYGSALETYPIQNRGARDFGGFEQIGDLLVIKGFERVLLLERGGMIDPEAVLKLLEVFGTAAQISLDSLSIDPVPRPDGSPRILGTIDLDLADGTSESVLAEISLESGALRYVGTATSAAERDYSEVDVSPEGRAAIAVEEGFLLIEDADGSFAQTVMPVDMADNPKVRHTVWTSDPTRPLMVTSRNRVHFYNPSTDRFVTEVLNTPTEESLHFKSLRTFLGPGGDEEVWGGATFGQIIRYRRQTIERITPRLPPRYRVCSGAQADTSAFSDEVNDVAVLDGYVYAVVSKCSAVLAIRIEDGCTSLIPAVGDEVTILDVDSEGLQAINAIDGELVMVGRQSRVFSLVP